MKNWKTLFLAITIVANSSFAKPQVLDKIAAVVNDDVILDSDINSLMQLVKLNTNRLSWHPLDDVPLRHQILERLILDQIILQIGKKIGIEVNERKLDQAIVSIAKRNNMTTDQMRNYLAYGGIKYREYRNQIRKEMVITEVRNNEVSQRIYIPPQDVDALVKQVDNQSNANIELKLIHILIPLPKDPTLDQVVKVENRARFIFDKARHVSNFDKFLMTYSADQFLIKSRMGWGRIQELPFIFAKALGTAKKGDVIGPIRSNIGFHILKVEDLRAQSQNIFVTEIHARHILLKPSPIMTDSQVCTKLQLIATDIKRGKTSFSKMAKKFSQDPVSAIQGGDLGWVEAGIYDTIFRNTLMKLRKGQLSAPVHSSFGWHLIELLDIRTVDKTDTAKKNRAYRMLFNHKFSEEVATWMQEERKSAYVKILNS